MRWVNLSLSLLCLFRLADTLPVPFRESGSRDAELRETLIKRSGNGMQHKDEQKHPPDNIQQFKPIPDEYHYATQTRVYSGSQLNSAAKKLMTAIGNALPFAKKTRVSGYPKPGTGFSKTASDNPTSPNNIAYHTPIGNTGPRPGPDRIYAHRPKKVDSQYDIGVSYHDQNKPIPKPPRGGGMAAKNHPVSAARPWTTPLGKLNKVGATVQLGTNIAAISIGAMKDRIKGMFSKKE